MPSAVTDVHKRPKPIVLVILDGWGVSPSWGGNAIGISDPPTYHYLWKHYPHTILQAFRTVAGPDGIVGSSEIGHASIGSGRIVKQDLTEVNLLIDNNQFYANPTIRDALAAARDSKHAVHLIGLLSEGGIHGSTKHAQALIEFAKQVGVGQLYVHGITDGVDSQTYQALEFVAALERTIEQTKLGKIATIVGRHYALDRDNYWDRTGLAYDALTVGTGRVAPTAKRAISLGYEQGLDDEHLLPTIIADPDGSVVDRTGQSTRIRDGDTVICWNFRADRVRQLTRAFTDPKAFRRFLFWRAKPLRKVRFVTMTDYHLALPGVSIAFPSAQIETTVGQLLANHNFSQLHVAESEKYAHVTYFFNGGREEPYEREERIIVRSPRAQRYDTVPAMSAGAITRVLERAIRSQSHDFIVANYANVDIVAHTGNLEATSQAVLVVDEALRRVANAVIDTGGVLMITADHGNAESVATLAKGDRETLHSLNPVPFILVGNGQRRIGNPNTPRPDQSLVRSMIQTDRTLADVTPTILELLGIPKPNDMTGSSLLDHLE